MGATIFSRVQPTRSRTSSPLPTRLHRFGWPPPDDPPLVRLTEVPPAACICEMAG